MPRSRNIKPGLFKNEILGAADPLFTLLFEGLWVLADRSGRLEDRPLRIKGEIFPYRDGINADAQLSWLAEHGFIHRYQVGTERYIQIVKFSKHQNPHHRERHSVIPPMDGFIPEKSTTSDEPEESPGLARGETGACPGLAPEKARSCPADSLIPDSLIPDSVVAEATTKTNGDNVVRFVQKTSEAVDKSTAAVKKPVEQKISNNVMVVFDYWRKTLLHEEAKIGESIAEVVETALGWGYTTENLCRAIDGIRNSPFHMGVNDSRTVHDGLKVILRDSEQVAKFMELGYAEIPARRPGGAHVCEVHPQSGLTDWGTCWSCYAGEASSAGD